MAYTESGAWELTDAERARQAEIVRAAYAANPNDPQGFMRQLQAAASSGAGQPFMSPSEWREPLRALGASPTYIDATGLGTQTSEGSFAGDLAKFAALAAAT